MAMRVKSALYGLSLSIMIFVNQSHGQEICATPMEPFDIEINKKQEPDLYEFIRSQYQRYLEEMETYLRCLEQERKFGLERLTKINKQFQDKFGDDAVFRYLVE
ncbi:MAG: hypothetical protein AAGD96_33845 [Chloroflexota bacterium]